MSRAYFSEKEILQKSALVAGEPLCDKCRLFKKCKSPKMEVTGKGKKRVLFIAEAPGKMEDLKGKQLIGRAGKILRRELDSLGVDLDKDCWKINAVNCHPKDKEGKNRTPTPKEVEYCRPKVMATIKELEPEKIILLGGVALDSLLGHRWVHEGIGPVGKWRGAKIPDRDLGPYWVFPTFHPSFVMRSERQKNARIIQTTFYRDLEQAFNFEPMGHIWDGYGGIDWDWNPEDDVRVLKDPDQVREELKKFRTLKWITAVDYETTGIKPYLPEHDIYTASIANEKYGAISFPMYPELRRPFRKFLESGVPLTAHNMKFEELWSRVKLGTQNANWIHCSMLAAHSLDNRRHIKSLKFQAYAHLGITTWALDVNKYLKLRDKKNSNSFNRIREAPLDSLLLYGGQDTAVQLRLALLQVRLLGRYLDLKPHQPPHHEGKSA